MRKAYLLAIVAALFCATASAQISEKYLGGSNPIKLLKVSASIGVGVPLGAQSTVPGSFGIAKAGPVADLSMFYSFSEMLGLTASLRGNMNNFSPLGNTFGNNTSSDFTVAAGNWRSGSLTAGPFLNIPLGQKVSFIVKGMAGVAMTSSPILLGSGMQQGPFLGNSITRNDLNFAYIVGPGFRFKMGNKAAIALNADYLNYQPQFVQVNYSSGSGMMNVSPSTVQRGTLNFSIGMVQGF